MRCGVRGWEAWGRVRRVLIYRLGSLGDHLVALPSYRLVARAFPEAERLLLTNVPVASKAATAEAVLGESGLVSGYMKYEIGERGVGALISLWWKIARWRPDVLVYMVGARGEKPARRDELFFRACGVRRIVGVPRTPDMQLRRSFGERDGGPWFEQEGERLARCVAELGDAELENPESWTPGLTAAERAEAAGLLVAMDGAEYFAMSLGTKAQSNEWGVGNWQALLQRVAAEWPGRGLAILGAKDEWAQSEVIAETWRAVRGAGAAVNLCGACSPRVSGAVMERARMFFGHDSGPAHMAAAVGAPVTAVYSSRMLPGTWVPHGKKVRVLMHWVSCGGCLLETCVVERKRCILSIGVDEVMTAVREQMAATAVSV